jgi:hypothetical protein
MLTSTPGNGPTTTEAVRELPFTVDRSRPRLATRQQPKLLTNQRDADDAELVTPTPLGGDCRPGRSEREPGCHSSTKPGDPKATRATSDPVHDCAGKTERRNPLDAPPKRATRQNQMPSNRCEQRRLTHHTRRHKVDDLRGDHQDATTAPIPSADSQGRCARYWSRIRRALAAASSEEPQ